MSKKHTRKSKKVERRVPVSAQEEERFFQNRLAKLKEEMQGIEEVEDPTPPVRSKLKKLKEATKVAKKKGKVEEVVVKPVVAEETEGNLVTAKELADDLGTTPLSLRKRLREAGMEKPSGRWEWPEDHPDLAVIRGLYTDSKEEVVEEKPAKGKKAKKEAAAPAPAPAKEKKSKKEKVVEVVEEDEDEGDEEFDLEELTVAELRTLCDDEGIKYSKKDKKPALIEKLMEAGE